MTIEPMTLVERLNNPAWVHSSAPILSPQLDKDQTVDDMREAAGQILLMRSMLSKAEQFFSYFSGETNHFVGPGTPKSMLAEIRETLVHVGQCPQETVRG